MNERMQQTSILHSRPSESAQPPEIDVTPIMNMFVILIPFLVTMAVFTHLSVIELQTPSNVAKTADWQDGKKPKLKLTAVVGEHFLGITKGGIMYDSLPRVDGTYQYGRFETRIKALRSETEIQNECVVAVQDNVRFDYAVRVFDICKRVGFSEIGLSSAPEKSGMRASTNNR